MTETRPYPQRARERIAGTKIIDRLVQHVMGEIELTQAQVSSARLLLSKVLPDMKSVEIDAQARVDTVSLHRLTNEQLMTIAAGAFKPDTIEGETVPTPKKLKAS